MPLVLDLVAALALLAAAVCLWRALRVLRGTQMMPAWFAAAAGLALCGLAFGMIRATQLIPPGAVGHVWYGVAVIGLTPLVCVLGARRPISRVWPWFVVLPLVVVLGLPSLSTIWRSGVDTPLRVETPTLAGFALVLAMAAGNYLLTRFGAAAALYALGVVLMVVPATDACADRSVHTLTTVGTLCWSLSFAGAYLLARRTRSAEVEADRVWEDFRDTFGVVWAKRVMDRINWTAEEEHWPARMELTGLAWTQAEPTDDERRQIHNRLREVYRWLLSRFVDDRWLDDRCGDEETI